MYLFGTSTFPGGFIVFGELGARLSAFKSDTLTILSILALLKILLNLELSFALSEDSWDSLRIADRGLNKKSSSI